MSANLCHRLSFGLLIFSQVILPVVPMNRKVGEALSDLLGAQIEFSDRVNEAWEFLAAHNEMQEISERAKLIVENLNLLVVRAVCAYNEIIGRLEEECCCVDAICLATTSTRQYTAGMKEFREQVFLSIHDIRGKLSGLYLAFSIMELGSHVQDRLLDSLEVIKNSCRSD